MKNKLRAWFVKRAMNLFMRDKISFSKMVELLNEYIDGDIEDMRIKLEYLESDKDTK